MILSGITPDCIGSIIDEESRFGTNEIADTLERLRDYAQKRMLSANMHAAATLLNMLHSKTALLLSQKQTDSNLENKCKLLLGHLFANLDLLRDLENLDFQAFVDLIDVFQTTISKVAELQDNIH